MLQDAVNEMIFILNRSKQTQKLNLLQTLVNELIMDVTIEEETNENAFSYEQRDCFTVPEICYFTIDHCFWRHFITSALSWIVEFCIIEGYKITNSIIGQCNICHQNSMHIVIEKSHPLT